jgi:hypothetical protein
MKKLIFVLGLVAVAGCGSGVNGSSGAAACATASTCGLIAGGISQCTTTIAQVNDPNTAAAVKINAAQVNCIAAAGANCDAARKCLNGGQTPAACTGNSQSCTGNVLTTCDSVTGTNNNNGTRQYDCTSEGSGQICIVSNGNTDCGVGTCSGYTTRCTGNVLQTCGFTDSIEHDLDCSKNGSTCEPSGLAPHCRGTGATCSTTDVAGALRCDGHFLVSCVDGQEAKEDCSRFNLGCFPAPAGSTLPGQTGFSCSLGSDCTSVTGSVTCEGNILHFCNNGKFDTLDCGANGFVGCDATAGGRCMTKTP